MTLFDADLIIRGGTIISVDPWDSIYPTGDLVVTDGKIVAVGESQGFRANREIDARGQIVIPGLVNVHTHECLLRGTREDQPLAVWLNELCFPMEHALRAEHTVAAAKMNQLEMIRGGTTTFVDMYRHLESAAQIVDRSGLRAVLAPQIMDVGDGRGETWAEAEDFVRVWTRTRHPRISAWVAPHAPYTVESEGYLRARKLADETGARIMTHLNETRWEEQTILQREGISPVPWLDRLGVLDGMLGAHGVWLTDADRALLAERGASLAYCPSSNMKLASGVAEVDAARRAGIVVGLGTDSVLSNNNLDMLEEMRMASLLQKSARDDASSLPAPQVLRMATIDGAAAIGMADRIGSLEVGKQADIAIVSTQASHMWPHITTPLSNAVEQLVYSAGASDVTHTIVDGAVLMADRHTNTLDLDEAREEVARAAHDLIAVLGKSVPPTLSNSFTRP